MLHRSSAFVTHHIKSRYKHVLLSEKANIHLVNGDKCVKNRCYKYSTEVQYRPASAEDKNQVLQIRPERLFDNGVDHIADRWNEYMSNPAFHPFVATWKKEIVAFIYHYVIDGGTAIVEGGARSKPGVNGMKIVADVRSYGLDYIKNMAPLALNNLLQVVNERKYYKRSKQYTIIERRSYRCYITSTEQLSNILRGKISPPNNSITSDSDILSDKLTNPVNGSMFPSGRFCVDYHPYSLTQDNVQLVSSKYGVHVTPGTSSTEKYLAVSFLSQYDGKKARCYNAEIYTDNEDMDREVVQHIIKAIDHITSQEYKGKVVLELQFNENCSQDVDNFVQFLGLKHEHGSRNYLIVNRCR